WRGRRGSRGHGDGAAAPQPEADQPGQDDRHAGRGGGPPPESGGPGPAPGVRHFLRNLIIREGTFRVSGSARIRAGDVALERPAAAGPAARIRLEALRAAVLAELPRELQHIRLIPGLTTHQSCPFMVDGSEFRVPSWSGPSTFNLQRSTFN